MCVTLPASRKKYFETHGYFVVQVIQVLKSGRNSCHKWSVVFRYETGKYICDR